ncbi:MAG: DUF177 domain-containing protein [Fretibacterium sp.]|nr:DUF177 domain-containing protein [Fretibacterium sp.]
MKSGLMPKNWHFIVELPPRSDCETVVEKSWDIHLTEGILFEGQRFLFPEGCFVSVALHWLEPALLTVQLFLRTEVVGECARCLAEASLAIQDDLMYLYHLCDLEWGKDTRLESDEGFLPVEVEFFGRTIDLADQVWETLLLLLPIRLLCKEDCRGLCPECGADLNQGPCGCERQDGDPRFAVLGSFIFDSD